MKLRIRDDSLRLRLSRSEVAAIGRGEPVRAAMHVTPATALTYALAPSAELTAPEVQLEGSSLTVRIPAETGRAWAESDDVSIRARQQAGDTELRMLIEKDFRCLAPREGEDEGDAFPHPRADQERC